MVTHISEKVELRNTFVREGTHLVSEKQAGEGLVGSFEKAYKLSLQEGGLMKTEIEAAEVAESIAAVVAESKVVVG